MCITSPSWTKKNVYCVMFLPHQSLEAGILGRPGWVVLHVTDLRPAQRMPDMRSTQAKTLKPKSLLEVYSSWLEVTFTIWEAPSGSDSLKWRCITFTNSDCICIWYHIVIYNYPIDQSSSIWPWLAKFKTLRHPDLSTLEQNCNRSNTPSICPIYQRLLPIVWMLLKCLGCETSNQWL